MNTKKKEKDRQEGRKLAQAGPGAWLFLNIQISAEFEGMKL